VSNIIAVRARGEIREKPGRINNSMFQIQPITPISYEKTPLLLLWFDAPYDSGCRDAQDDFPRRGRNGGYMLHKKGIINIISKNEEMDKGAPHQKTSLPYTLPTPRTFTTELVNESELEVTGELELFVQGSVHSTPEFLVDERYHYSQPVVNRLHIHSTPRSRLPLHPTGDSPLPPLS
jgi:hypothetical protein